MAKKNHQPERMLHDPVRDRLTPIYPLDLSKIHSLDDLVRAMGRTAFTARQVGDAADVLEAMLGAIYLDRGLETARRLIERLFRPRMVAYVRGEGDRDYKTILQELASAELRTLPEYRISETGPDHEKEFTATVYLGGKAYGTGTGRSKKEAEQQAAHQAYRALSERPARADG